MWALRREALDVAKEDFGPPHTKWAKGAADPRDTVIAKQDAP